MFDGVNRIEGRFIRADKDWGTSSRKQRGTKRRKRRDVPSRAAPPPRDEQDKPKLDLTI